MDYDNQEDPELNRAYYDDGAFDDAPDCCYRDDSDIPTYDELELEGRYYNYGSRAEYEQWRRDMIASEKHHPNKHRNNMTGNQGCAAVFLVLAGLFYMFY